MKNTTPRRILGVCIFATFCLSLPTAGHAAIILVDCTKGHTIQSAVDGADDGDVIEVKGVCKDNVLIREDKDHITLDGNGSAAIDGPDPTRQTLHIRGRDIVVTGFIISGGLNGINPDRGGTARIQGNIIQKADHNGIAVTKNGFAQIVENIIRANGNHGILVTTSSNARIGFISDLDTVASPNIIQGNGGNGITVNRGSIAEIVGNKISGNANHGITVGETSSTRIGEAGTTPLAAGNAIGNNGNDGIIVRQVSFSLIKHNRTSNNAHNGISVRENSGVLLDDNATGAANAAYGIQCALGAYATGAIATLDGSAGVKDFTDLTRIDNRL